MRGVRLFACLPSSQAKRTVGFLVFAFSQLHWSNERGRQPQGFVATRARQAGGGRQPQGFVATRGLTVRREKGFFMSDTSPAASSRYPFIPYRTPEMTDEERLAASQQFLETMTRRRSTRDFSSHPVPYELIENAIYACPRTIKLRTRTIKLRTGTIKLRTG